MRRSSVRIAVVAAGAIMAVGPTIMPAGAAQRDDGSAAPGGYVSGAVVGTAAAAEDVRRFWTPERMRAAIPARAVVTNNTATRAVPVGEGGRPMSTEPRLPSPEAIVEAARAAGVAVSADAAVAAVTKTAGKAFFIDPIDGKEHVCSGATVNSAKRRIVVTAGHCVHNGQWMRGWIFAPGYNNGAPVGTWIAGALVARSDWVFSALPAADVGVAIMADNPIGQRIVDVVGGNGLAWNQPLGQRVDVFGYPFGSSAQQSCAGNTFDADDAGVSGGLIGTSPCHFGPGGSGGPMLLNYGALGPGIGYVNSVVSTIITILPNDVFGPYFDNINAGLLYYAESISP